MYFSKTNEDTRSFSSFCRETEEKARDERLGYYSGEIKKKKKKEERKKRKREETSYGLQMVVMFGVRRAMARVGEGGEGRGEKEIGTGNRFNIG